MPLLEEVVAAVPLAEEIPQLIEYAAGGRVRNTRSGATEFLTAEPHPTLFLRMKEEKGAITQLEPGPALSSKAAQARLLDRLRDEAAITNGEIVSSRVLFSERPLKGAYQWRRTARITPCPPRARIRSGLDWSSLPGMPAFGESHLGPPFPFVLETRSYVSTNPLLTEQRALRSLDTWQFLFTLLLNARLRYVHHAGEREWVSVRKRGRIEYHLLYPGFDAGISGRASEFAKKRIGSAGIYAGPDYYNHLWATDKELLLPPTLDEDIDLFFTLSSKQAQSFRRACYWYALGIQLRKESSISTVAFATAIECLLPRPSSSPCPTCKKPIGAGPTRLFNDHLRLYGTLPKQLVRHRDEFYGLRSTLVHGGHAGRSDVVPFTGIDSQTQQLLLEVVTQRSLRGWLRDGARG